MFVRAVREHAPARAIDVEQPRRGARSGPARARRSSRRRASAGSRALRSAAPRRRSAPAPPAAWRRSPCPAPATTHRRSPCAAPSGGVDGVAGELVDERGVDHVLRGRHADLGPRAPAVDGAGQRPRGPTAKTSSAEVARIRLKARGSRSPTVLQAAPASWERTIAPPRPPPRPAGPGERGREQLARRGAHRRERHAVRRAHQRGARLRGGDAGEGVAQRIVARRSCPGAISSQVAPPSKVRSSGPSPTANPPSGSGSTRPGRPPRPGGRAPRTPRRRWSGRAAPERSRRRRRSAS